MDGKAHGITRAGKRVLGLVGKVREDSDEKLSTELRSKG